MNTDLNWYTNKSPDLDRFTHTARNQIGNWAAELWCGFCVARLSDKPGLLYPVVEGTTLRRVNDWQRRQWRADPDLPVNALDCIGHRCTRNLGDT